LVLAVGLAFAGIGPPTGAAPPGGREAFRGDTFGSEQLWTDVLQMHQVIQDQVDPLTALGVGLKVDVDALPQEVLDGFGDLDLEDPATTVELLRLGAVVGVIGQVEGDVLVRVGITCALCHSTVDDSFDDGIGHRLDGWANLDLDPGRILALSPAIEPEVKDEIDDWGPGMYDPRHHVFDGTVLDVLHDDSTPVVIPSIFGLKGVRFETFTGDGPISYWNSYVGVTQMGGMGDFVDERIDIEIDQEPDLVTPQLGPLLRYQEGLETPKAPKGSFNRRAAARGRKVFDAACASCHIPPLYTDVNNNPDQSEPLLHDADEVGQDSTYADRSAHPGEYRTTPLRALWQHPPYFHDGGAADLEAVVDHYDEHLPAFDPTAQEKADLVQFLKSL
jgi:mono/diheme cytochrome c family protein